MPDVSFYSQLFDFLTIFFIERQGLNIKLDLYNKFAENTSMGNKINSSNNDQFINAINQLKKSKNEYPVQKVSTHLQQRYKAHLFQSLRKQEMSKNIKKLLFDCIENKIKKQDLTSTVAVLNSLRSNNAEQLLRASITSYKSHGETKNVVVKFDQKKLKIPKTINQNNSGQFAVYREEDTLEGRIKHTGNFISKQLNKPYHPFRLLCKRFSDILLTYLQSQKVSANQKQYQTKQQLLRKTVKQFCLFMVSGCIGIYRKWVIQYTGLQEKKYQKWMYSLVLNQIWSVTDGYMLNVIIKIIKKIKIPLKIDLEKLSLCSTMGVLQPKDFAIDQQLQIQGHFFNAIFQMSSISQKKKPAQMLKQLENIKNSICIDIDNYHKLCQKGQIYEVNGDNIMGIVAYILSKVSTKLQQISTFLLFMKLVYGQGIFYNMDTSSYMYSTIWGAIQYLESKKFQIPNEQMEKNGQDQTNGTESFIQNCQNISNP